MDNFKRGSFNIVPILRVEGGNDNAWYIPNVRVQIGRFSGLDL